MADGKTEGKRWPKRVHAQKAALDFLHSSDFPSCPSVPAVICCRVSLADTASSLKRPRRSRSCHLSSATTPFTHPHPPPPAAAACGGFSRERERAGNSIRFLRPQMVTGLKLSDLRGKRPGADSSERCSCYARNVNACCAFRKRAGGFSFFRYIRQPLDCPDTERSKKDSGKGELSSSQRWINPYALQPKTARGLETDLA